ncbi:MAG: DUF5939 domain-containing protein, partial [Chloroflexota bacterium]
MPAEQLWPLVADTQRLNHAIGLPVMRFTTQPLPTGGSRVIGEHPIGAAALALLGQLVPEAPRWATGDRLLRRLPRFPVVRWIEHPFEWEAPRRYTVLRDYYWSPLALFPFRSFRCGVELLPVGDRATEVTAFADVESRPPLGALVTRLLLGPRNVRRVIRQCRRFEDYLLGRSPEPFPQIARRNDSAARSQRRPPSHDAAGGAGPWQALVGAGVEPDLADRLGRHALEAADEDVVCMRPFELADRWGTDRRETLAAFLHATTAGLLTMMWTVLCPNCRLPKAEYRTLPDLEQGAHCDFCNISFDAALDRQVEVRFSVAPSSRDAADRRFCSGGPMNAPHVVGQAVLAGGEVREVAVPLAPGTYRLRSPQARRAALLEVAAPAVVPAGPLASAAAGAAADGVSVMLASDAVHPPLLAAGVGVVRLRARNDVDVPALLAIERPAWPDTAATAAMVGTLQQFRDLFSSEALAPGLHLAVQRLAFLFTDLTGSTALYQALGQARAFRVVQDHFRLLRRAITGHNGALVKTFGDAVMAVF